MKTKPTLLPAMMPSMVKVNRTEAATDKVEFRAMLTVIVNKTTKKITIATETLTPKCDSIVNRSNDTNGHAHWYSWVNGERKDHVQHNYDRERYDKGKETEMLMTNAMVIVTALARMRVAATSLV